MKSRLCEWEELAREHKDNPSRRQRWIGGLQTPGVTHNPSPMVFFLQNPDVKRGFLLCYELNSLLGFVFFPLDFCDLKCTQPFSVVRGMWFRGW